ncbi:MAG: hypothetical protein DLM50_06630 [Candidatus Meridianibacter frigidus]|nr:MAG: hypothetical protein DLM50_06630 [Candidatus Eremiobacteraeota bacterium]
MEYIAGRATAHRRRSPHRRIFSGNQGCRARRTSCRESRAPASGERVGNCCGLDGHAHTNGHVDVAARNGGDEFCAILRHATKSSAIVRARALCDAVAAANFGVALPITASIGVCRVSR